jgi:hypothetical protein
LAWTSIGTIDQAHGKLLAICQMKRDIAAIIDIRAAERRGLHHHAQDFLRHAAGDGRHRRDEMITREWSDGCVHAARDDTLQAASRRIGGRPQQRQFFAEFVKQARKTSDRGSIGRAQIFAAAARLHDQVDRTILQMQPLAVLEPSDLRLPRHHCASACGRGAVTNLVSSPSRDSRGRT